MNLAVLEAKPHIPSTRDLMDRALDPHVLLGMPHLNAGGLSETWLMKDLGHRHWLMLARHLGMEDADFRTADGREAYAAICATSLRHARLELARPNSVLVVLSSLSPVSRTQYASLHRLLLDGQPIGEVELVSTFVYRSVDGDNRSLIRSELGTSSGRTFAKSELAADASAFRRRRAAGQSQPDMPVASHDFTPSQSQEFNGAGLFYFAEFQALANRALEAAFTGSVPPVIRRDVFFAGNIAAGETVTVRLFPESGAGRICEIARQDGSVIAEMRIVGAT